MQHHLSGQCSPRCHVPAPPIEKPRKTRRSKSENLNRFVSFSVLTYAAIASCTSASPDQRYALLPRPKMVICTQSCSLGTALSPLLACRNFTSVSDVSRPCSTTSMRHRFLGSLPKSSG